MDTWPSYARIIVANYAESVDDGVVRTEMDGGLAKERWRFSKTIVTRDATILCSQQDRQQFSAWRKANRGQWFTWRDPVDGVTKQARMVKAQIKWSRFGVYWQGALQLETLE